MTQMDRNGNLGNICDETPNSHGPELEGALNVREGRNCLCPPDTAYLPRPGFPVDMLSSGESKSRKRKSASSTPHVQAC